MRSSAARAEEQEQRHRRRRRRSSGDANLSQIVVAATRAHMDSAKKQPRIEDSKALHAKEQEGRRASEPLIQGPSSRRLSELRFKEYLGMCTPTPGSRRGSIASDVGDTSETESLSSSIGTDMAGFFMCSDDSWLLAIAELWLPLIVTGVTTGLVCVLMGVCFHAIGNARLNYAIELISQDRIWACYAFWSGTAVALVVAVATALCFRAPMAAASGIPEMKGFLNGCDIRGIFDFRTFWVKVVGISLCIAAGAPIGREGPMIHLGGMVAAAVGSFLPGRSWAFAWKGMGKNFEKRDLVTCGIAAGVAAAFRAPVGGVLYVLEELCTNWSHALTWKAFICAESAMLMVTALDKVFPAEHGLLDGESGHALWHLIDLPLFAITGVACGISMAAFTHLGLRVAYWRSLSSRLGTAWAQILEAGAVMFVVASYILFLPMLFGCKEIPTPSENHDTHGSRSVEAYEDDHKYISYQCMNESQYYNDMASLYLRTGAGGAEDVIRLLLSRGSNDLFSVQSLLVFGGIYYFSGIGIIGVAIPYGLFVPHMLFGAVLGQLFGKAAGAALGEDQVAPVGVYALVGMAGALAGFTRTTIALTVVLLVCSAQ